MYTNMYLLILFFQLLNSAIFTSVVNESQFHQTHNSHTFNLVFQHGRTAPDGFPQDGILVNGQFPGPTLRLRQRELLRVKVKNLLPTGLTIHFHGIFQKGTVASDGVPGITQYEILPNGSYTYSMEIGPQSGTFMYHAHTGLDQNWAMGALVVEEQQRLRGAYSYDYEETIILSQCWHVPISEIAAGILGNPFQDVPDTDSILINGRSHGDWNSSDEKAGGYVVINVKKGKTYRFRVISLAVDTMLSWSVDNHTHLTVIEMDSILTTPVTTDHLEINAAQRYSVLVTMDQPVGNYWIRSQMIPGPGPGNGRAILHYEGAPDPVAMRTETIREPTAEVELTEWILDKLHPSPTQKHSDVYPVPTSVTKEFVIKSHQVNIAGRTQFDINGRIFKEFHPPLLHQLRHGLDFRTLGQDQHLYEIILGDSVQIVFVNSMSDDGECEQHPWHMHGHAFHVVGQGPDDYDPVKAKPIIEDNVQRNQNQFRDVVTLFPSQAQSQSNVTGTACGWVAIRFVADNPGVWMVHCHLTAHMLMGKQFFLYEHSATDPHFNEIS